MKEIHRRAIQRTFADGANQRFQIKNTGISEFGDASRRKFIRRG
jgi:hypothetical protein